MAKFAGIGGVFLHSPNAPRLAAWYRSKLGIPVRRMTGGIYYLVLEYRANDRPRKRLHTVLAIFPATAPLPKRRNGPVVNFRIDDLDGYVARLRRKGVRVDPVVRGPDGHGEGKFTHLVDPDGNQLELWEPSTGA